MTLNHLRVTVGMPVYNDPDGLRRSIPSIMGQTWRGPLQLLVIDDGSTDDTAEVLDSLAALYAGIEVVRSPVNEGRPFARNRILRLAGEDYLAWCDSGDLWHPRKLELQLAALTEAEQQSPEAALLCTGSVHWVQADTGETRIRVPDVEGDQLRNALIGTLYPYLQGLVGRAAHFRSLGGFDERLLRRQDYDFLVRFLAGGGRVVAAPRHVPVFTYVKSYSGGSARVVTRANHVIRSKHQSYYRRYGRRLERQVRSKQDRLIARFHSANGRGVRSLAYRTLAWLWAPEVVAPARRAAGRVLRARQHASAAAKMAVRVVRPLLPVLRRTGVVDLARRAGLGRTLNRLGVRPVAASTQPDGTTPSPGPSPETNDGRAEPSDWLRAEQAYRQQGLLHSAELALRQGLDQHPGDNDLLVRLVELLPLRKRFAECVDLWSANGIADIPSARALTYARVARAYRLLDRPAEALTVAESGLRRWPDHPQLSEELWTNRAELVDWNQALSHPTSSPSSAGQPGAPVGEVTSLGSLAGGDGPVDGRISLSGDKSPRISVVVNGTLVASTVAAPDSAAGGATFALNCVGLRTYLGDGDVLSVDCAGRPLPIKGGGTARTVRTGYLSRFAELRRLLATGHVFTKFGELKMASTPESKAATLAFYNDIASLLSDLRGYPAFPFYGNLLGAVREHDIISHDAGGFDMGYVSDHQRATDVKAEFLDICRALLDRGHHLRLEPWSVYVRPHRTSRVFVDVNYAWFTESGELQLSFGWRYAPVTDRERFYHQRESLIGPHPVRVPGNAEAVLEQIYGPSWAVPDQGFALEADLRRDADFLLTEAEMLDFEALDPDRVEARLDHFLDDNA